MTIKERVQKPTPRFFRKLRNTGLVLAAVSGSLLAAPVALPAIILQLAGYLAVAGTIAATVSQTVTSENTATKEEDGTQQSHGKH
jgi:outer membrane lipoprotein-sorting protein